MSRLDDIDARLRELERERANLVRFGDGNRFIDGDVIRFTKTYDGVNVKGTFTYAAIKTPRGWYVTGRSFSREVYTYEELIDLITRRPTATQVWAVETWRDVLETVPTTPDQTLHAWNQKVAGTYLSHDGFELVPPGEADK